jgi:hypothetical protein
MSPLLFRLGALQHGLQNAGGMDPRSAATLVDDLSSLEELVVRHEIELPSDLVLQKPAINELATAVVIPSMQEELNRNATLISTWTLADLPDLLRSKRAMAGAYHLDPRFALARTQREALIPHLLTSFLTIELVKSDTTRKRVA